jgi:hypothetical protein
MAEPLVAGRRGPYLKVRLFVGEGKAPSLASYPSSLASKFALRASLPKFGKLEIWR